MSKITLTDLVNLENQTTAVNAINNNNAVIETAFDNTLSRDGTLPNTMGSALDMNSNRIVNLPDAISSSEPATLGQLNTISGGGTIQSIPAGGTTSQVLTKINATDYNVDWENPKATALTGIVPAANMPALTGAVTSSSGTVSTTLATAAAFTLKANNTAGTASPTDISISALTAKATPAGTDLIIISDEAASHAFKKATVSSLVASGAVTSIAGNTGPFTLSTGLTNSTNDIRLALNNAVLVDTTLTNPTGTTSGTGVVMGLGGVSKLTPVYSTRVHVTFRGAYNLSSSGSSQAIIKFGTGTAPTNGTATAGVGTASGNPTGASASAAISFPYCQSAVITGLTPGTAYWFDISLTAITNTASLTNLTFNAFEF